MPINELDYEDLMKALNHPIRRKFVQLILRRKEALSPREASRILDEPLATVSYHVRVLVQCEAVTLVDTEPVRGSVKHFYRPSPVMESRWVRTFLSKETTGDGSGDDG